jgi:hypothetical protein
MSMSFYVYFRRWPGYPQRFPFDEFMDWREDLTVTEIANWFGAVAEDVLALAEERVIDFDSAWSLRFPFPFYTHWAPPGDDGPDEPQSYILPTPGRRVTVCRVDGEEEAERLAAALTEHFRGNLELPQFRAFPGRSLPQGTRDCWDLAIRQLDAGARPAVEDTDAPLCLEAHRLAKAMLAAWAAGGATTDAPHHSGEAKTSLAPPAVVKGISRSEAARRLRRNEGTITRMLQRNELRGVTDERGEWVIDPSSVEAFIQAHPELRKSEGPAENAAPPTTPVQEWDCAYCDHTVRSQSRPKAACKCGRTVWVRRTRPPMSSR